MSSVPSALPQILDAETTTAPDASVSRGRLSALRARLEKHRARLALERAVRAARSAPQDSPAATVVAPRAQGRGRMLASFATLSLVATVVVGVSTVGLGVGAGAVTPSDSDTALSTMAAALDPDSLESTDLVSAAGVQELDVTATDQTSLKRAGFESIAATSFGSLLSSVPCAISSDGSVRWPLLSGCQLSSGFGYRIDPSYGGSAFHAGVDLTPGAGQTIVSMADGVVTDVGYFGGYGYRVEISHPELGVSTLYGHMIDGSSPLRVGQRVSIGDKIGLVGSTGKVTGAHLHFEIHVNGSAVDPVAWLTARI